MAEISKITLPSGSTYDIKDKWARDQIALLSGSTAFAGITTTPLYDQATTSDIQIGGETVEASNGTIAIYGNKEFIYDGTKWLEFGDLTAFDLTTEPADVFGIGTTFAGNDSNVTFSGGTTDVVLGENTTFSVTNPTITVTPEEKYLAVSVGNAAVGANGTANAVTGYASPTKGNALGVNATFTTDITPTTGYIKAVASNGAVTPSSTAAAITGFGAHTTDTFVKSVTAETNKKLVVTSITPTNGTESVSKVTKTASKLVTTSVPNVTSVGTASTWNFAVGSGADAETLIISGANNTTPTLGTAITAATGNVDSNGAGSDVVTAVTISDKNVAKVGTAVTVATGATATDGDGDAIVTGVTIGSSASAITALGTPTTSNCITGVSVTQPTITLSGATSTDTGATAVLSSVSAATSVNTSDSVSAITALGTPSTASVLTGVKVTTQPTVTITAENSTATGRVKILQGASATATNGAVSANSNDEVTVVKTIGTATAEGQTITVTPSVVTVVKSATLTGN